MQGRKEVDESDVKKYQFLASDLSISRTYKIPSIHCSFIMAQMMGDPIGHTSPSTL